MLIRSRSRRAFTLWELIAVLALLFIVAVVFWPVFSRNRDPGKPSGCQSNLKQILLGFELYVIDNQERYPLVCVTNTSGPTPPHGWADALQPYIKNPQVYQCPNVTNDAVETPAITNYTDYWYNANFIVKKKTKFGAIVWEGANESMLGSPAQTILIGDGGNTNGTRTGDSRYNQCGDGNSLLGPNQTCRPSPVGHATYPAAQLHLDRANFGFAGGHVKWLRGNNPTSSAQVINNGATQKSIGAKATFSLLNK